MPFDYFGAGKNYPIQSAADMAAQQQQIANQQTEARANQLKLQQMLQQAMFQKQLAAKLTNMGETQSDDAQSQVQDAGIGGSVLSDMKQRGSQLSQAAQAAANMGDVGDWMDLSKEALATNKEYIDAQAKMADIQEKQAKMQAGALMATADALNSYDIDGATAVGQNVPAAVWRQMKISPTDLASLNPAQAKMIAGKMYTMADAAKTFAERQTQKNEDAQRVESHRHDLAEEQHQKQQERLEAARIAAERESHELAGTMLMRDDKGETYKVSPRGVSQRFDSSSHQWKDIDPNDIPASAVKLGTSQATTLGTMSQEAIDDAATKYRLTGTLPTGISRGGPLLTAKILNAATEQARANGQDGEAMVLGQQANKADAAALGQLSRQQAMVMSFEKTAVKNADLVLTESEKTDRLGSPSLARWLQAGKKNIEGDAQVARLDAAMRTYVNEYARVLTTTSSGGVTSDAARKEANDLLNSAYTKEQVRAVVSLMKTEMENRRAGYEDQMAEIKERMAGHADTMKKEAAKAKEGDRSTSKSGRPIVFKNGGWQYQ